MAALPQNHFLNQPRPDVFMGPPAGVVDTTTVSAHDFDIDARTGFMPPQPPLDRLPEEWEPWENALQDAVERRLKLGESKGLSEEDANESEAWRRRVRELPILPTLALRKSELLLRRAHHVLAWTMHFYINTLPPTAPILIPPPISIPLLQVSQDLVLPPLLTYSDDVLYNWAYLVPPTHLSQASSSNPASDPLFGPLPPIPTINNLKCLTLFTSTNDEAEFYLTSARIELAGVRALALMRATMDEAFVGDDLALRRIALYLRQMAIVLAEMTRILLKVREGCDPEYFYREIRPWFKGQDSMPGARTWVFEGIEDVEGLKAPTELSGPSAGQSALIHAIDIFLGVDHFAHHLRKENRSGVATPADSPSTPEHSPTPISPSSPAPSSPPSHASFLARMQLYMPRHHRAFLRHLAANPRPLRALVEQATEPVDGSETSRNADLLEGYNEAVRALKSFRDAHLRIVALYIVGPSRRVEAGMRAATSPAMSPSASSSTSSSSSADSLFHTSSSISSSISSSTSYSQSSVSVSSVSSAPALVPNEKDVLEKGTGGTLLMPFLKSVRDRTAEAEFVDRTR